MDPELLTRSADDACPVCGGALVPLVEQVYAQRLPIERCIYCTFVRVAALPAADE